MIAFANRFYDDVQLETFFESCGVADLITTCYGGRNRIAGEEFVKGKVGVGKILSPQLFLLLMTCMAILLGSTSTVSGLMPDLENKN